MSYTAPKAIPGFYSTMGVPPPSNATLNKWCPWASEQLYSGRRYYKAYVSRWSSDGLTVAQAELPMEYGCRDHAIAAALRFIAFLHNEENV